MTYVLTFIIMYKYQSRLRLLLQSIRATEHAVANNIVNGLVMRKSYELVCSNEHTSLPSKSYSRQLKAEGRTFSTLVIRSSSFPSLLMKGSRPLYSRNVGSLMVLLCLSILIYCLTLIELNRLEAIVFLSIAMDAYMLES
jgi:hypothetical protein